MKQIKPETAVALMMRAGRNGQPRPVVEPAFPTCLTLRPGRDPRIPDSGAGGPSRASRDPIGRTAFNPNQNAEFRGLAICDIVHCRDGVSVFPRRAIST
jgi:hypothetical protein